MSELHELISGLNIPPEKLTDLASKVSSNPFVAMAAFGELGIGMDFLTKLLDIVRRDPSALTQYASSLGVDAATLEAAQKKAEKLFR